MTTESSLAVNKCDKEKNNSSKESKNSTTRLTFKQVEVLQRVAGKPVGSFVTVVKLGSNPLEDEQLEFSAFFKV